MTKEIKEESVFLTKEWHIQALFDSGIKNWKRIHNGIKRFCKCTLRNVQQIVKKIKDGRSLVRKERKDKSQSSLDPFKKRITKMIDNGGYVDCNMIKKRFELTQTVECIQQWQKNNNIAVWDTLEVKPQLTLRQKEQRVEYCEQNMKKNIQISIFDDEMKISTHYFPKRSWRLSNRTKKRATKPKFPLKINVWGAITVTERSNLFFFKQNMDGDIYRKIITTKLHLFVKETFVKRKIQFYSDNDPKHKAKDTLNLLKDLKIKRIDWPSNSPDLNPIENIWALIKREINKKHITSINYLKKQVVKSWEQIDQNIIKNAILSWSERCEQIIEFQGDSIPY